MTFHPIHYLRVASHFWPWERAFWLALFHDAIEDGWMSQKRARALFGYVFSNEIRVLSRPSELTYARYIECVALCGGDIVRVKRADLAENYARACPSLRKRYAKAMAMLA